jgi:signal transduction histidine kinase
MTPVILHPNTEDTLRAREVYRFVSQRSCHADNSQRFRFYQPHNSTKSLPNSHSSSNEATDFATSRFLLDTALTAFAQLIALRFDAQRAIISLTDHEYEYFLAESTSTLSHLSAERYAQNQFLSRSGSKVSRDASLCEQTLHIAPYQGMGTFPASVVPDLTLNGKLNQLECVKGAPYLRFYCGVALTNNKGVTIGSVYVVDATARAGASFEQIQFLTMMAGTVMDYLENIRIKEEVSRVTRMSQALHAFIEGAGTMYGDWRRLRSHNLPAGAGIGYSWKSGRVDVADIDGEAVSEREPLTNVDSYFPPQPESGQGSSQDAFTHLLRITFSRAANLVREGMGVDGTAFFGAPVVLSQGRSAVEANLRNLNGPFSESGSSSADEDYADVRTSLPSHTMHSQYTSMVNTRLSSNRGVDESAKIESNTLGFSTRKHRSLNGDNRDGEDAFSAIDQNLLISLVRHYPEGKLFAFDHRGPISRQEKTAVSRKKMTVSMKHQRDRHKARKRAEIIDLLAVFPGARQIFFVPLYDSISECFIGSFTWSTSDTRIFSTENDLSYLIAFGHSVMTEVSRLNTISADRAKDQFINNVSHELRSPLHGILASAEFLAETPMDGFQRSLVDNVDGCGRTLLDTIEHILDFSQVKKFGKETKQSVGIVAEVDISAVIEEVLEGVYAGFQSHGVSSHSLADTATNRNADVSDMKEGTTGSNLLESDEKKDGPNIILDIDFREQWRFPTVPGTWRRLTMNVFGNALKYTPAGWVKVKLEARNVSPIDLIKNDGKERTMVILTISDSGKGISGDFIKTKLFTPFSQV